MTRYQVSTTVSEETHRIKCALIQAYDGGRGALRLIIRDAFRLLAEREAERTQGEVQRALENALAGRQEEKAEAT
jgi:hypothetical protein